MKNRTLILLALLAIGGVFVCIAYMPASSGGKSEQISCREYIPREWRNEVMGKPEDMTLHALNAVNLSHCYGFEEFLSDYLKTHQIDEKDQNGNTALYWAALSDNYELVEHLLAQKADANTKNAGGMTPLMAVSKWEIVDMLLKHGAAATEVDNLGFSVLMHYLKKVDVSIKGIQLLVGKGADIKMKDKSGHGVVWSFFDIARGDDQSLEALKYLITIGAPLDFVDENGKTLLMHAASRAHSLREVQVLSEHGLSLKAEDKNKKTPLFYTLEFFGNVMPNDERNRQLKEYLQFYSGAEVNFNHKDKDGLNVLNYQNRKGNKDIAQMLQSFGAKE